MLLLKYFPRFCTIDIVYKLKWEITIIGAGKHRNTFYSVMSLTDPGIKRMTFTVFGLCFLKIYFEFRHAHNYTESH